jgi:hypothetical protein
VSRRLKVVVAATLALVMTAAGLPADAAAGPRFNGGRVDGQDPYGEVVVGRGGIHIYLYDRRDDHHYVTVHYVTTSETTSI